MGTQAFTRTRPVALGPMRLGVCGIRPDPPIAERRVMPRVPTDALAVNRSLIERLRRSAGRQAMPEPARPALAVVGDR